jgi:hypothetical protein
MDRESQAVKLCNLSALSIGTASISTPQQLTCVGCSIHAAGDVCGSMKNRGIPLSGQRLPQAGSFSPLVKKCLERAKMHRVDHLNRMRDKVFLA